MIAFLESDALTRPTCITPKTKADDQTGNVTSTIAHGELFLHPKGKKEERYRLRWAPGDKQPERALPAGTYTVTGYRHVATGDDKVLWVWSTTSRGFATLEVKAGETTSFPVRRALRAKARAVEHKGKHRVGLVFNAEHGLGNTLYRDGKRIAIEWQLLDEKEAVLAKGAMRYG